MKPIITNIDNLSSNILKAVIIIYYFKSSFMPLFSKWNVSKENVKSLQVWLIKMS